MQLSNNRKAKFGPEKTKRVWQKTNGHCWYCGVQVKPPVPGDGVVKVPADYLDKMFTMEHRKPRCLGGKNHIDNLVPCCRKCNNLKGNFSEEYLRMKMIFTKNKWPKFNNLQFDFLLKKGINLHELDKFEFYFEKKKLKS